MLAILPILLLITAPGVLALIHLWRPRFGYSWLIVTIASLIAWALVLIARLQIPLQVHLTAWQPAQILLTNLALILDRISWPFSLAIATLTLSVVLTAVVRLHPSEARTRSWAVWAASLAIAGLGLAATMSGNLFTLLLAWVALDLGELFIRLASASGQSDSERVVIAFSARAISLLLAMGATFFSTPPEPGLGFPELAPPASTLLLIAAGLRLGVFPLNLPLAEARLIRRGLDTQLSFVPAAVALVVIVRLASTSLPGGSMIVFLILASFAALFGGIAWAGSRNAFHGLHYWIIGMSALAILSALVRQPDASLAWSLAVLLPGSMLALYTLPHRRLLPLLVFGLLGITALPLTPSWQGVRLYTHVSESFEPQAWWAIALLAQAALTSGYIRHALWRSSGEVQAERWKWGIYPWGLALLPLVHIVILLWGIPGLLAGVEAFPSLAESWPALANLALAGVFLLLARRGLKAPELVTTALRKIFSFAWLYRLLWVAYRAAGRLVNFLDRLFEGEGGILWTVLILTLLLALLVQII